MADQDDERSAQPPRSAGEGIRIIGAEEAAAALETGAAEGRRPADAPRFGDLPSPPSTPRPPDLRFPLEEEPGTATEAIPLGGTRVEPPPGSRPIIGGPAPEMQHWTEPATGEVPAIFPGQEVPEDVGFSRGAPRWRASSDDWDDSDLDDMSDLAGDTRLGALDTTRTEHSDMFEFDEQQPAPPPTVAVPPEATPQRIQTRTSGDAVTRSVSVRDNRQATIIGVALGALFLVLCEAGPKFLLVLVAGVILALTAELYGVLRRAGYKPATLLGLVASLSIVFGAYWKGERAVLLVIVLVVLFSFFWYLAGVVHARPTVNIAATLLVFAWAGVLGSFAGLLLKPSGLAGHSRDGVAFLLGVVLCVVVNDVVAYVAGQAFGRTQLAPSISPGKTVEGFVIALVATVLTGTAIVGHIHPFGPVKGFWLGLVLAVVAPLGDLAESMVKRDIGLKDMGASLPGHGGLADRFDGLLFALPAAYYLLQILHVGTL